MAYTGYLKFHDPSLKVKKGNVDVKPDKDLPKTGQPDGVDAKEQNPNYKSDQGWQRCIGFDFSAAGNVEVSAGVSVGNINDACAKFLTYTGENTAIAYRALYNRAPFDVELVLTDRLGQDTNKMQLRFLFKGAVFRRITTTTGDPKRGMKAMSIDAAEDDLKEVDVYEIVYQSLDVDTFGKKTHNSSHGTSV